jgi:large conductance mechanosensitive channel
MVFLAIISTRNSDLATMDKMEKSSEKKKGFVKEFMDFLQAFGVVGLAIGFVIGVASSAVVNSLVKDLINPIVGLVLPTGNLSSLNATITSPVSGKPSVFLYGDFISQIIYFVIIALVVFIMYKQLKRMGLTKM